MKYYHIIYNSSERPMDGGVGFGIRTATEGTPEDLLKAVKSINFFTDDWESYDNKPTPAQMKDNPSTIEYIAKNYAVTNIADEKGHVYYLIARRAYVGFDYSFYKNGMPTRPGNFVIDYYIFDSIPDASVYEILYEKALDGSNHFIPKSVHPTEDNEEMRTISVGNQPSLPVEKKEFTAEVSDALDKDVIKLYFAYLQSKNNGKKLVVKTSPEKSLKITADFYRLLPTKACSQIRTYINLRTQGTNDWFDIFFIHEDYPHQIYDGLYDFLELDKALMPNSHEARNFASELESLVSSSFAENKADIDDILTWLSMPEYDIVKSLSKQTNESFFNYCIHSENFLYENLKDQIGGLNIEFLKVLCPYLRKNPERTDRFTLLVKETMSDMTADKVLELIKDYNTFEELGFDLKDITQSVKNIVCSQLLSNCKLFKQVIDTFSLEGINKFFVKSIFEEHAAYLDSDILDSYMIKLYRYFFTEKELAAKEPLCSRFLSRGMDSEIFCAFVNDLFGEDKDAIVNCLIQLLHNEVKPFKVMWAYIERYMSNVTNDPDFLCEFKDKLADNQYAPMFYYSIKSKKLKLSTLESIEQLTNILSKNENLKRLVAVNYAKDGLYHGFYNTIKEHCKDNPQKAYVAIKENILDFLNVNDPWFTNLSLYLSLVISEDPSSFKQLDSNQVSTLFNIIVEQANIKLFDELLPCFINASQEGAIEPHRLASQYVLFHPAIHTKDLLLALVSDNLSWYEMDAIILKDIRKKLFADALNILKGVGMVQEDVDKFMTTYYKKDYESFKRKNKIKNVLVSFIKLFIPKKREKKINNAKK